MSVCCECCVLSGSGLGDELINRPEESYRLCCVVVCDLETSRMRRLWPALGRTATKNYIYQYLILIIIYYMPRFIPVAARSKAWICGCWLAGIVGSNPTGSIAVCLL